MLSEGAWCGGVLELRSIVFLCIVLASDDFCAVFCFPPGKLFVPVSVTGYLK
jgi:hypothetical protein